jgi:hypothetical protein
MSKQTPRQASKQGQSTNKQSDNQSSKQNKPAKKQTTNAPTRQTSTMSKQAANVSSNQANSANKPLTRQAARQAQRQQQQIQLRNAQRRAVRNKRILISSLIAAAVVVIGAVSFFIYNANAHNSPAQGQATSSEQVVNPAYPPVDGIYCDSLEQTAYHIHAHLTIYIDGNPVSIPQGIGIASDQSCFYWLHTHSSDGVVHIEFPKQGSPTLGNFLDIWGQEFSQLGYRNQLASTAGWTVYVNGKQVNTNFNQLVLQPHMVITIAYNSPNITPDTSFNWPSGE